MNFSVLKYYQKNSLSGFEDVIIVDKNTSSFDDLQKLVNNFPKAWWELVFLNLSDRIEFSRDFCLKILPYSPNVYEMICLFFTKLEDIKVIFTKKKDCKNYEVELVYSTIEDSTFFRGKPPIDSFKIAQINRRFNEILPQDFLKFLQIHNGFARNSDSGIILAENIYQVTKDVQDLIDEQKKVVTCLNQIIDPKDLIFFYRSYQKMDFQCFYTRWHLFSQIGNVFYSFSDNKISNYHDKETLAENLAFPYFLDWLIFYLEIMDLE